MSVEKIHEIKFLSTYRTSKIQTLKFKRKQKIIIYIPWSNDIK